MPDKIVMTGVFNQDDAIVYTSGCYVMKREYGKTPNGNDFDGNWVLRQNGEFVDFDRYRLDLALRNNMVLVMAPE